jgi:hypothetical protein
MAPSHHGTYTDNSNNTPTSCFSNDKAKRDILAAAHPSSAETIDSMSLVSKSGSSQQWRRRGQRLRAQLIEKDEAAGGQPFALSNDCPIQRYYQVADKVRTI